MDLPKYWINFVSAEISGPLRFESPSKDLIAGMLAVSPGILLDLESSDKNNFASNVDIASYLIAEQVSQNDIETVTCGKIKAGEYGIWLQSKERYFYNFYKFINSDFLQGVMSLCNSFNADFRYYIFQNAFDSLGNYVFVQGVELQIDQVCLDTLSDNSEEEEEKNAWFDEMTETLRKDY